MKNQTAVEWLVNALVKHDRTFREFYGAEIEQAKALEKEQIINFAKICLDKALDLDIRTAYSQVEKYYNETYNK